MDPKQNGNSEEKPITHVDVPNDATSSNGTGPEENGQVNSAKPSLSELASAGLTAGEIEMAKKQGIAEDPEKKEEVKQPENQGENNGEEKEGKKDDGSVDGVQGKKGLLNDRFRVISEGKTPDQIIAEVGEKGALSQEQEKVLLASLTQNGQTLYWAQKKERQKRQKLEQDLAAEKTSRQKEIDELKAQNAELSKLRKKHEDDPLGLIDEEPNDAADPKKKPVTLEDLERIDAEKAEALKKQQEERRVRAAVMKESLDMQQEEARERYPDFDVALGHVANILEAANNGELDRLYPDPREQTKIMRKASLLLNAFANADTFEPGEYNAADMTYELAKEHPEFGKSSRTNATKTGETDADGNREDAKRVVTNANRRGSSATLTGGGSRRVALEELTPEQARRIPTKNWNKLPKEARERLLRS